jgi:hypothetical protein
MIFLFLFPYIPYVRVGFGNCLAKLNFHIKSLEVHVNLNQSQDAMWHFFGQNLINLCRNRPVRRVLFFGIFLPKLGPMILILSRGPYSVHSLDGKIGAKFTHTNEKIGAKFFHYEVFRI